MRTGVLVVLMIVAGAAGAAEPEWLQALRAREANSPSEHEIRSPDGWFRVQVPAKLSGKVEEDAGSYSLAVQLAPDVVANCELIREGFDPAFLLNKTAATTFELLAQEQGKIEQRAVERIDAGRFGGSPYIALDWLYRVATPDGPKVGSLKQVASLKDGHGVYCVQNDVGYSKSFEALVRAFVESLQVKDAAPPGLYDDINVVTLGASKVGIATTNVARDAEGDLRVQMMMSLVLPVTADTLRVQDSFSAQFVRPDGTLINAVHVVSANGEIESNLKLQPVEDGGWQVVGEHKGKALDAPLADEHEPSTFLQQTAVRKALLARPDPVGAENVEWQWIPEDPLRLSEARVKIVGVAGDGLYKARESAGPLQADTVLERATGFTHRADIALGGQSMTIERIYFRGSL